MTYFRIYCAASIALLAISFTAKSPQAADVVSTIDFNREVRPILSNNCFQCHGRDSKDRQADLRLDVWESAGQVHGAEAVAAKKDHGESELIKRITSDDPEVHMPPP